MLHVGLLEHSPQGHQQLLQVVPFRLRQQWHAVRLYRELSASVRLHDVYAPALLLLLRSPLQAELRTSHSPEDLQTEFTSPTGMLIAIR